MTSTRASESKLGKQPKTSPASSGWNAHLRVNCDLQDTASIIRHTHSGPLRIQKALYPEEKSIAHVMIVHPPGGICSGDVLALDWHCSPGSAALVTTPGATKWYRKADAGAGHQTIRLKVDQGAALEWLPQEAIAFEGCEARSQLSLQLRGDARCIGWDVWVLGRKARGETFARGLVKQHVRIERDGVPLYVEHAAIHAAAARRITALGNAGGDAQVHVNGLLWAVCPPQNAKQNLVFTETLLDALRAQHPDLALSCPEPEMLLARMTALNPETLMNAFKNLWASLRPAVLQRPAIAPRIWST
jgi:urease accessory protein